MLGVGCADGLVLGLFVSEQPNPDPRINTLQLHTALPAALQPNTPHDDHFAHRSHREDRGDLRELVDAARIRVYQSLNHAPDAREALARWGQPVNMTPQIAAIFRAVDC